MGSNETDDPKIWETVYDEATFKVTDDMKQAYDRDGVIIVRKLLSDAEVKHLLTALVDNPVLQRAWELDDGEGAAARMLLWNHPGDDVTGMVGRCRKVVETCQELMKGEVYHYHTKLMMKEAKFGGKLRWHQDYGYWYKNGNLRPDLMTCFIPLDQCRKENGCLQVVRGSHHCGRIDHAMEGGQTVTNQERVDLILQQKQQFPHFYVDMEPGDAIFFHCNVLHRSDRNTSDRRRWAFVMSYNRADNNPVVEHHHPFYTPLSMVENDAILKCKNFDDFSGKEIMDPSTDKTVRAKMVESNYH